MKKINKLITGVLGLFALLLIAVSCDDMNEIQSKFTEVDEQIYLGKVDSLKSYPGFGRSKITWYIGADPKIEKTIIYWNMRQDSIVKDFVREVPGIQKDSIIVENLPEGSSLYEFRNINSKGETSLYSVLSVQSWGEDFAKGLSMRGLKSQEFDYASSTFELSFSPTYEGDSVIYSEVLFTDVNGIKNKIKIDRDTDSLTLTEFPDGGELQFRTVFFVPTGIDTVYSTYEKFRAPEVIFENGEKLSIGSGLDSKYFDHDGLGLYEWNSAGDLIEYGLSEGTFSQSKVYPALAPRTTYRDFFFYDDDKFITVTTANALSVNQLADDKLTVVGNNPLGTGFTHPLFLPSKGYFFALGSDASLVAWTATNEGKWGVPLSTPIAKDLKYTLMTLYKFNFVIAVDEEGYLWSIPISTTGQFMSKNKIGSGWDKFKKIVGVNNFILAMDENGDFYKFDFDTERFWIVDNPM